MTYKDLQKNIRSVWDKQSPISDAVEKHISKVITTTTKDYKCYQPTQWTKDYDLILKHKWTDNNEWTIEVKYNKGINNKNKYFGTACLEITEYQYSSDSYVPSHWLHDSQSHLICLVDGYKEIVHFYDGKKLREWTTLRKHMSRHSTNVLTTYITMDFINTEAGWKYSLPVPGLKSAISSI